MPTLYRGVAYTETKTAANASAHIGWPDQLRFREGMTSLNIESHFRHALEIDSNNMYVHAMWSYWILMPDAKYEYGANR